MIAPGLRVFPLIQHVGIGGYLLMNCITVRPFSIDAQDLCFDSSIFRIGGCVMNSFKQIWDASTCLSNDSAATDHGNSWSRYVYTNPFVSIFRRLFYYPRIIQKTSKAQCNYLVAALVCKALKMGQYPKPVCYLIKERYPIMFECALHGFAHCLQLSTRLHLLSPNFAGIPVFRSSQAMQASYDSAAF